MFTCMCTCYDAVDTMMWHYKSKPLTVSCEGLLELPTEVIQAS